MASIGRQRRSRALRAPGHRGTLVAWPLALLATAAQAQTAAAAPGDGGAQVLVTGTRLPLTASGLAQNVTIIDAKEIAQMNPARIEDVLARVTGAYVDQAGRSGGFSSLYMRGAENSHLLVMLDGVKLNDPTTTRGSAYDLSSIDVDMVERIEILRGPASAVYGGEALAGVLNIITRKTLPQGVSGRVTGALGGDHHGRIGGSVGFGQGAWQAQASAGHYEEGESSSNAALRLNSGAASLRFAPGGDFDAELFVNRVERESQGLPDDSGGDRLAVNRDLTRRDSTDQTYGAKFSWGDARRIRLHGVVSVYDRQEHADNAAVAPGERFPVPAYVSDTDFRRENALITATHEFSPGTSLVAGLEWQNEKGSLTSVGDFFFLGFPQTLNFSLDRDTSSAFAELQFRITDGVSAQVGLRYDRVDGLDSQTTPHLGLVWSLPGGATVLKANYNEGFKPPSFFALGFPIGGNPDLRPERSQNAEFTLSHRFAQGVSGQLAVFQTRYEDLVDFDGETFTNINRGTIVVKGLEPTLSAQITPRWRTEVGLTLLNIDVRDGLQPLRNRPERKATASVFGQIDARWSVFGTLTYVGEFLDRSNPTGDIQMPGFTTFDAGVTWRQGAMQFTLAADNVFNRYYEQFVGFPSQGARLRVVARVAF